MRELLVTITLLSLVSSEEPEPKKRLELPPEVDPNFWPVRGRRSYWDVGSPRFFSDLIEEENDRLDGISGRETDYAGYTSSSKTSRYHPVPDDDEIVLDHAGELRAYIDARRGDRRSCAKKRSISVVLPLGEGGTASFCDGRCGLGRVRSNGGGIGRRDDDLTWRQRPLYVEEPGWIAIDYSRGFIDPTGINRGENEDPFFVARGKKWRYGDDQGIVRSVDPESRFKNFEEYKYNSEYGSEFHRRNRRDVLKDNYESDIEEKIPGVENNYLINDEKLGVYLNEGSIKIKKKSNEKLGLGGNKGSKSSSSSSSSSTSSSSSRGFLSDYYEKPRNISPQRRDKHSNLQGILDEPFFISRGKKGAVENKGYLHVADIPRLFLGNDELPIKNSDVIEPSKKPVVISDIFKIYRGRETSELRYLNNDGKIDLVDEDKLKKGYQLPPRNRRGMLDEIFSSDDPFYVARGKRLFHPRKTTMKIHRYKGDDNLDHFKIPIDKNDKELSIFAKTLTRRQSTKLMKSRQLSSNIIHKNDDDNNNNNNNNNNIYYYLHNFNEVKND